MKQLAPMALVLACLAQAQGSKASYTSMAPLDQYLIADHNAEIALAKSAAPKDIADHADVMVLERQGFKTVAKGTNGFVCIVDRSWSAPFGDPEYWNPKIRGPVCFNPAAARSYLPITLSRTQMALAGKSESQIRDAIEAAFDKKELPALAAGSMSYMLSKQGYLGDHAGHFHPHLMFWVERTKPEAWGVGTAGSPVFGKEEIPGRLTIFIIPVEKWSDGTSDTNEHM